MNADQIVGERIHIEMRRRRMTQAQLGEALGITQAAAGKKLFGMRSWTLDELLAAARFLDLPVTELLPENDYAPVLAGRGRNPEVRHEGFEPPTFWSVASVGSVLVAAVLATMRERAAR